MTINVFLLFAGISVFPAYQAYQCCLRGKFGLGALIVAFLSIFLVFPFADDAAYGEYIGFIYLGTFVPSVLSFFLLKKAPIAKDSMLRAAGFIGGISLLVMIGALFVTLNRYAFVKQSEREIKIFDRWTGSQKRY